ncbi:MAG: hypothetical protein RR528_04105 [Angelakisella sp.]
MDQEMLEMFNLLIEKMDGFEKRMDVMEQRLDSKIDSVETRITVHMENNIGKRLDALSDGYKMNYEQHWETETRVDVLDEKVGTLEDRVSILEHVG